MCEVPVAQRLLNLACLGLPSTLPAALAHITGEDRQDLTDSKALTFGIGTIFVFDPDNNLVEFVDPTRGIFLDVLRQSS